ncbi:DUF5694 domain-containing protein [Mucilaginibacter aquatilis]|uniref:Uncharacterized protein n=1 Tax=Mucilaginibacter aquatilis TaxID=1517760 RepID=A0A6I4I603_9SPHI|nr:DUF5694 domain-containing protein [Mucilaginibacter aquatilis]MVN90297.1 hypothetical protein [Mucilaginibacter aquatilis]
MKLLRLAILLCSSIPAVVKGQATSTNAKTNIMFLGCTHFGQEAFYKQAPSTDLFSSDRQKDVTEINRQLALYKPDLVLIECEPAEQHTVDSLYNLFKAGKLNFNQLNYGRAEAYQFGFNLAKASGLNHVFGVDYYNGLSTRLIKEGEGLQFFGEGLSAFSNFGRSVDKQLKDNVINLKQYLLKLNSPDTYALTYYTLFINPARVTNGAFGKLDASVDSAHVDKKFIGAEYISIFYNRELKIFSNILSVQQATKGKRILVIMGQRHAAVLSKIIENDPAFTVVPLSRHLK